MKIDPRESMVGAGDLPSLVFHTAPQIPRPVDSNGFTRVELVATLAALALLVSVALPALATSGARSKSVICANNLGRIGQAFTMWASEHGDHFPWEVSGLPFTQGFGDGTKGQGVVWVNFYYLSNQISTPRVFWCPSDPAKVKAIDFLSFRAFGDGAVSYLIGHPFLQEGRSILSADRNIRDFMSSATCPYFNHALSLSVPAPNTVWDGNLHRHTGQLLFSDDSVEQTDNRGLRAALATPNFDNASFHYIAPGF